MKIYRHTNRMDEKKIGGHRIALLETKFLIKIEFKKLHWTYQWDRDALEVASDKMHSMDDVSVVEAEADADVLALVLDARKSVDIDTVAHNRVVALLANLMLTTGFQLVHHVDLIN